MFVLGLKGPIPPGVLKRFANDLGGALFAPFRQSEASNWVAGVNDHFTQRALGMANRHGLVVLGVRAQRQGSISLALPDLSLQFLGATITERNTSPAEDSEEHTADSRAWDRGRFTAAAVDALDRAAAGARAAASALDTRRLFLALEGSDMGGQWERLWLEAGDPTYLAAVAAADPEPEVDGAWQDVPLTRSCSHALTAAMNLARIYDFEPAPVGALAFGLIADPRSAAAQALSAHGLARPALKELLREITSLSFPAEHLDALGRASRRTGGGDAPEEAGIMPDDGGLLHLLATALTTPAPEGGAEVQRAVTALCGRSWIPSAIEQEFTGEPEIPCPQCREEVDSISERLETDTGEFHWAPFRTEQVLPFRDGHVQTGY